MEVAPFHAGIATEEKGRLLEAFNSGDLQVICATNAFGMGVDKPDIRLVIHHDIQVHSRITFRKQGEVGEIKNQPLRPALIQDQTVRVAI